MSLAIVKNDSEYCLGGSSFYNGIVFYGDRYKAKFVMDKSRNYKVSLKKIPDISQVREVLRKIPIIKGLASLIFGNKLLAIVLLFSFIIDLIPETTSASANNEYNIVIGVATIIFTVVSIIFLVRAFWKIKSTWKYHGAEHKAIYAVLNDIDLDLESVKKCPRIAKRCGTNYVVFILIFLFITHFFMPYNYCLLVSHLLAYELFDLEKGDTYPIIRFPFKFGYWCQQKIFTTEPEDYQLFAAIDTMKQLVELDNNPERYEVNAQ